MRNYITLFIFLTLVAFQSCDSNTNEQAESTDSLSTTSEQIQNSITEEDSESDTGEIIKLIRERYQEITSNMETYRVKQYEKDGEGAVITITQALDGDELKFASKKVCSDHGCQTTSYYYWRGSVFFKFQQDSHWVGNSDTVEEQRTCLLYTSDAADD